jgi:ABC-type glycerol-3-phosphate transport system permease component
MKKRLGWAALASYAVSISLAAVIGFPLLWMVVSSLKPAAELFTSPPHLLPSVLTFDWYRSVILGSDAIVFFRNSLIVALATTVVCLLLGTLAAYGVTRFDFPGKAAFLLSGLFSYLFPAVVLFVPLYMIVSALGLIDNLVGLVICHVVLSFPFALWMLRSFFANVPREIDEAAWMDGASFLQTFTRVVLPLVLPGMFSVGVFVFVLSWNEFLFASVVLTGTDVRTVPVGIAEFITSFDVRWGEIMAMGTLSTVPVVVLFLFVQRFFLQGVLSGAVKG